MSVCFQRKYHIYTEAFSKKLSNCSEKWPTYVLDSQDPYSTIYGYSKTTFCCGKNKKSTHNYVVEHAQIAKYALRN